MAKTNDRYNLNRFVVAQDAEFENVKAELKRGRKSGHWMWFVFPQLKGLGTSTMSMEFGIAGRAEAAAYLAHPILGPRLRLCTQLVLDAPASSAHDIFDCPDDLKFRSSMTLFAKATSDNMVFLQALAKFFKGKPDRITLQKLKA